MGDDDEKLSEVPVAVSKAPKAPHVASGKFSVLRRHTITESDVRRVLSHLKVNKTITANDNLTRPRLKKRKGAPPDEPIPWVRGAELAGSWQQLAEAGKQLAEPFAESWRIPPASRTSHSEEVETSRR